MCSSCFSIALNFSYPSSFKFLKYCCEFDLSFLRRLEVRYLDELQGVDLDRLNKLFRAISEPLDSVFLSGGYWASLDNYAEAKTALQKATKQTYFLQLKLADEGFKAAIEGSANAKEAVFFY